MQGGIVVTALGAFGTNVTMPFPARQLCSLTQSAGARQDRHRRLLRLRASSPSTPRITDYAVAAFEAMDAPWQLKLERGKGPTEVIVIDQVQRPSEN